MDQAYVERLTVPLRWWALAVMFLATVLLACLIAMPTLAAVVATAVLSGLTATFFVMWGSAEVAVVDGELRAGTAHIPLVLLADPVALDEEDTRRLVGVDADARAFLLLRPYVHRAVSVRVVDPADPTPYWVVATRHPRALAEAITSG